MNIGKIIYEKKDFEEGAVASITLNNPEKLNAIDMQLAGELNEALTKAEDDDDVKAVILKGAGKCFSAGYDLGRVYHVYGRSKEESEGRTTRRPNERARLRYDRKRSEDLRRMLLYSKVLIAQVHGYCIGGGYYTQACCDFTIASEDTKFGHPEQRLGFPGFSYCMPIEIMSIGLKRAREMLYTGKFIDGKEAARIGLINKAVPIDKLEEETMKFAKVMTLIPRDGIAIGKAITQLTYERMGLTTGFSTGYIGHTLGTNLQLEEGEFNFLKTRRDKGLKEAIRARDSRFENLI